MQGRRCRGLHRGLLRGRPAAIVDYLVEEGTLHRQSPSMFDLLLQTSHPRSAQRPALRCRHGPGRWQVHAGGARTREPLPGPARRPPPVVSLPPTLCRCARGALNDEQPDRVPDLHGRATEWYERNGERSEAIRYALAARDSRRAADLVELAIPAMRQSRQESTIRRWLEALPDSVIQVRPVLSVHYAGAFLQFGQLRAWKRACRMPNGVDRGTGDGRDRIQFIDADGRRRLAENFGVSRARSLLHFAA